MLSPFSITSLSQGKLQSPPKDDADYWKRLAETPQIETLPFWRAVKMELPRWSLRFRAKRS